MANAGTSVPFPPSAFTFPELDTDEGRLRAAACSGTFEVSQPMTCAYAAYARGMRARARVRMRTGGKEEEEIFLSPHLQTLEV